ncbi:MAG: acyl-CoA thioesterase [Candidatus Hinthialibacter sp.]
MNKHMSDAFPIRSYPYRVFYADTDAGGVVYYAQYLRMFEQTRTLYMEDCGLSLLELANQNCLFVCRRVEVDYQNSARLGDNLLIRTGIADLAHCYITFAYEIICSSRMDEEGNPLYIAEGITQMAAVSEKQERSVLRRIPKPVSAALADQKE